MPELRDSVSRAEVAEMDVRSLETDGSSVLVRLADWSAGPVTDWGGGGAAQRAQQSS